MMTIMKMVKMEKKGMLLMDKVANKRKVDKDQERSSYIRNSQLISYH
jgi:hypothetical protein